MTETTTKNRSAQASAIPTVKPRAYSYLRFSTPEQAAGDSFRRQSEAAEKYARLNGLLLDTSLTFRDLGVSAYRGANADAGRLADFLEGVKAGQIEPGAWLLVESLDRLSRMVPRKAVRVLENIIEEGITVVTMNDGKVYTADNIDQDHITFLLAILTFMRAHEESATKGKRVRAAWDNKRATAKPGADKPYTRQNPAWLRWNDSKRKWELISDRASVLRRIYDMTASGIGQRSIAQRLDELNVAPWGRARNWGRSYIKKLLENPAVIGTLTPHIRDYDEATGRRVRVPQGDPVQGYYPAAIDADTWNEVQSLAMSRRHRAIPTTSKRPGLVVHALAHLAKCERCGSTMTRVFKGRKGGKPKLVCTSAKRSKGCQYRAVKVVEIEDALFGPGGLTRILADMPLVDAAQDDRLREIDASLSALGDVLDGMADMPKTPALTARQRQVERVKADLVADQLAVARQIDQRSEAVTNARVAAMQKAIEAEPRDYPAINAALVRVFSRVVIDPDNGMLRFVWAHSPERNTSVMYRFPVA